MRMTEDKTWEFLEKMAEKTMQWEGFHEKSSITDPTSKDGLHSIENSIATKAKIATLMRRIEELEVSKGNPS